MRNEKGFTLIEMLAVLIILGIIVTIAATKIINLDSNASDRVVDLAIEELTVREKLTWSNCKLKDRWSDIAECTLDEMVFDLGKGDVSGSHPNYVIDVNGVRVKVVRSTPTMSTPAIWSRNE